MVDFDKAVVAKIHKQGKVFEILVDSEKALEFRIGKCELDDAIVTEDIFSDAKKGMHASEHELEKIFKTKDNRKIVEEIIKHGQVPLTAEHQKKLREQKRKQIINLIHVNAVDPATNTPHPPNRIENALDEVKVRIDEHKSAEEQVQEIVNKIRAILPIKYEIKKLKIKIPAQYTGKSYPIIKQFSKVLRDEWKNDGSLLATIEIPAGMQESLFDKLNNLTHGSIESEEE